MEAREAEIRKAQPARFWVVYIVSKGYRVDIFTFTNLCLRSKRKLTKKLKLEKGE